MAARMAALSAKQPGFLGIDSARGPDGLGITTCYWRDLADIAAWKADLEHQGAQARGKAEWYAGYSLHIARVERVEGWVAAAAAAADATDAPAD
jgi:heme-degrading monooxygenase HmoA